MGSAGVLGWIGTALEFVGLVLIIPGAFLLYRATGVDGRRRRAEGVRGYLPGDGARISRLVRAQEQDCGMPDTDRARLSALARTLISRRPLSLILAVAPLTAWGRALQDPGPAVLVLAAVTTVMVPAVVTVERQARDGQAFLRRFAERPAPQLQD